MNREPTFAALALFVVLLLPAWSRAQDTFSIVAVDTVTGEVGSAGASCINNCIIISDVHPGIGAVHTQALWDSYNQSYAAQLMDEGHTPQEIIDSVTRYDVQDTPSIRQYGVVTLAGPVRAAAFTGANCLDYKGHIVGPYYSIQGNILIGREVLEDMEARFLTATGTLADRLMAALQGAKRPGADSRCLTDGTSSKSSFMIVANHDDFYLDLEVLSVHAGVEPIDSLQKRYDQWKLTNSVKSRTGAVTVRVISTPDRVLFEFENNMPRSIEVSDVSGRAVLHVPVRATEYWIERPTLAAGIYFYRVSGEDAPMLASGKFIIE